MSFIVGLVVGVAVGAVFSPAIMGAWTKAKDSVMALVAKVKSKKPE